MALLLQEINYNKVKPLIVENKKDGEAMYIEGIFMQANVKNRNGRIYPIEILENACKKYHEEFIVSKRAFGELNHPESPTVNPERASIRIVELKRDGNNIMGKAKVLDENYFPCARVLKGLIKEGSSIGISSRGLGSLKEDNGTNIVQDDFQLITAGDIVHDPSAPHAFLNAVAEAKEWVCIDGRWMEATQKIIHNTPKAQLEEMAIREFKKFLKRL